MIPELLDAFGANTTLTTVSIDSLPEDAKQAVCYFGKRNKYRPLLAQSAFSMALMPKVFEKLQDECGVFGKLQDECDEEEDECGEEWDECGEEHHTAALSIIFNTLRDRNDWKEHLSNA